MLKEFVVLKELSLLLKARNLNIFSIFTAVGVESKVLINLDFAERNHLRLRKSGVDEGLRLVDNTGIVLFPVTRYTSARQLITSETLKRFTCTGSSLFLF